jgi:hypothetical protein
MTTATKRATLAAAVLALSAGWTGAVSAAMSPTAARHLQASGVQQGVATIMVLHSRTNEPLGDMPVFVTPQEGTADVQSGRTNADGTVTFKDLAEGAYLATVTFNNHSANAEFEISVTDAPVFVTIYFNPDID